MTLLSIGSDAKTVKGEKLGYYTAIQYLAPSDESGVMNTCPNASAGCRAACLYTAGFAGVYKSVNESRMNRTKSFFENRNNHLLQIINEIKSLIKKAAKDGKVPCIRLNGTSDIAWESVKYDGKNMMEHFPDIQFYDYTKNPNRMKRFIQGKLPKNYSLTFSRSEENQKHVDEILALGGNVAVVFRNALPSTYLGKTVINGDESDLRFNDGENVIVGLTQKGKAKKDESGFVVTA
jgi:hypothetical protein